MNGWMTLIGATIRQSPISVSFLRFFQDQNSQKLLIIMVYLIAYRTAEWLACQLLIWSFWAELTGECEISQPCMLGAYLLPRWWCSFSRNLSGEFTPPLELLLLFFCRGSTKHCNCQAKWMSTPEKFDHLSQDLVITRVALNELIPVAIRCQSKPYEYRFLISIGKSISIATVIRTQECANTQDKTF